MSRRRRAHLRISSLSPRGPAASRAATGGRGFFSCNTFIATSLPTLTEAAGRGLRGLAPAFLPVDEPVQEQERRLASLRSSSRRSGSRRRRATPEEDCLGLATLLFVARCRLAWPEYRMCSSIWIASVPSWGNWPWLRRRRTVRPIVEKRALRLVTTPAAARSRAPRQPSFCVEPGCAPSSAWQEVGWRSSRWTLTSISERVNAGIRCRSTMALPFSRTRSAEAGALGQPDARAAQRRSHHLQSQPAHHPSNLCVAAVHCARSRAAALTSPARTP